MMAGIARKGQPAQVDVLDGNLISACKLLRKQTGRKSGVTVKKLLKTGLSDADLDWLNGQGYVLNHPSFADGKSHIRLSPSGQQFAAYQVKVNKMLRELEASLSDLLDRADVMQQVEIVGSLMESLGTTCTPYWDARTKDLWAGPILVKHFRKLAQNQMLILDAFQEQEWQPPLDDPLPLDYEIDQKQRLHDTIKDLNRSLSVPVVYFGGDGTGEGVLWRFCPPPPETTKA